MDAIAKVVRVTTAALLATTGTLIWTVAAMAADSATPTPVPHASVGIPPIKMKLLLLIAGAAIGVISIVVGELMVRSREEKIRAIDGTIADQQRSISFLDSALREWPAAIRQTYLVLQLPANQFGKLATADQTLLDCLVNIQKALRGDFNFTVNPTAAEKLGVLEEIGLKQPGNNAVQGGIIELIAGGEKLVADCRNRRDDLRAQSCDRGKEKETLQASCSRIRVQASAIQIFGLLIALGKDLVA
ncbi:MAG TPA: hypothetical protein VMA09_20120 [Candidatus Binataceae bacterium]|nr:hypothetical protein [Candidatus Binataceae bacterium]